MFEMRNVMKWAKRADATFFGPNHDLAMMRMIEAYNRLPTIEDRLFAAYHSFNLTLKDNIRDELNSMSLLDRKNILHSAYSLFSKKGSHGCAHGLKWDYTDEFGLPASSSKEEHFRKSVADAAEQQKRIDRG